MKTRLSLLLFLLNFAYAHAQLGTIQMKDSTKVVAKLLVMSDTQIQTTRGVFELAKIYKVSFTATEMKRATAFVPKLEKAGIIVEGGSKQALPDLPTTAGTQQAQGTITKPGLGRESGAVIATEVKKEKAVVPVNSIRGGFGPLIANGYGGLVPGIRAYYAISIHADVVAGYGFSSAGNGINAGLMFNTSPAEQATATFAFMYGYNALLSAEGSPTNFEKLYYGPSIAIGTRIRNSVEGRTFWHLELTYPFRSSEYENDFQAVKNSPTTTLYTEPWPILISVGINYGFVKRK